MRVVYDKEVRDFLYEYDKILKKKLSHSNKYARSKERREEKVKELRKFLQSLGSKIDSLPICDKKKLGQKFDDNEEPLDKSLKQTNYKDESEFTWSISLVKLSEKVVKIYRIMGGNNVDEEKSNQMSEFKELLFS